MVMRIAFGIVAAFIATLTAAQAQSDYPAKPITIIVPYAAGGPSDGVTRILADELSKVMKNNVIIDNKGGGGTVIGTSLAAKSKPDGYTLLQVSGSFVVNPAIRSSMPYDTVKDFSGIAVFLEAAHAIVTYPGSPLHTMQDLIAEAKKRTDRPLTFGSSGVGASSHMAAELLERKADIKLKHIAYPGEAAGMSDALAGRIDFQVGTWSTLRPHVESGKLKLLSIIYRNKLPEAPNAPMLDDLFPSFSAVTVPFNAIMAPAGLPADVKAKLSAAMKQAITSKSYEDRIRAIGSYAQYKGPEETDAFVKQQLEMWSEVAKAANIKVD
jgi:tripartite-type tricarboxylate transporter receptor subunit TctC